MTRVPSISRAVLTVAVVALGGVLPPGAPAAAMHAPIEGFGAVTPGGAGRAACVVTSLFDSGSGTLRECLSGGNRRVVFAVAGTIALASQLDVHGPFVTIDGFTAPAPGITLRGGGLNIWDRGDDAHDIIVRGLRIRDVGRPSAGKSATD